MCYNEIITKPNQTVFNIVKGTLTFVTPIAHEYKLFIPQWSFP